MKKLVVSCARSSLVVFQKRRSTSKVKGNLANLHRSRNEITTKSKRKSFNNIFKNILFSHFILTHLDFILGQIYHNFYNKFVFA